MSRSSYAPLYDLFKLVVAIILLLIFLFFYLNWKGSRGTQESVSFVSTSTPHPSTQTPSPAPTGIPAAVSSTEISTPIVATNTPMLADTPTQTPTTEPSSGSPTPETSPTLIVENPSDAEACSLLPPQLQVGIKATIKRRLNFRSSPGISNNWILTNIPNTQVDVIGGPVCTRYENGVAYLWWQIKLPDGSVGWSAEASALGAVYFMEPVR
ncbi:MAG TPA: hypothetical protein PKK96_04830 [Anaerolineales bacterium]|nr:hypothetical protein [Anaerolineales bacterium]HNQ93570.1 hypothetical protein [Anaerolineales bacterium]HNS60307.1 hypothetical protein [Anaerolineales bacterium]